MQDSERKTVSLSEIKKYCKFSPKVSKVIHQHPKGKTFIIAYSYFKGICPLVLQVQQFDGSERLLLVKAGTEVATQPVGIYYPNETPEHPLKTIKVLNLLRLPFQGADNCHGMFLLPQEEQVLRVSEQM